MKSDSTKHCLKCGRSGHLYESCFAKKDIYGNTIMELKEETSSGDCPRKKRRRLNEHDTNTDNSFSSQHEIHPSNRFVFSSVLDSVVSASGALKSGVYVLRLESGKYYIGSSEYIESRVQAHFNGHGSHWTKLHKPIERILPLTPPMTHLESWERLEFINRVMCHGIENVRGWAYTTSYLTMEELYKLLQDIAEAKNLCRRCFRDSHFISNCKEETYAEWVGGKKM
jgi:hypothetical protein